jgi:hypothetical protein
MLSYSHNSQNRILPSPAVISLAARPRKSRIRRLALKDSCFAAAFLSLYVATYLAAGFAAVTIIEWAWTKLFS